MGTSRKFSRTQILISASVLTLGAVACSEKDSPDPAGGAGRNNSGTANGGGSASGGSGNGGRSSSATGGNSGGIAPCIDNGIEAPDAVIDTVYFGQTHLHEPDADYFALTGNRDTLIKAHVIAPGGVAAPTVRALLNLNGETLDLCLEGPANLPESVPNGPGVVQHSWEDSYTGVIPAEWVKHPLTVNIQADDASRQVDDLKIGAPTEVSLSMFDVHVFEEEPGVDYEPGWEKELENNWPITKLEVSRAPGVLFSEVIAPGQCDVARPVRRASNLEELGDGEQAMAAVWKRALIKAAGRSVLEPTYQSWRVFYVNIFGVPTGGEAGGYSGVGDGGNLWVLVHELGHALGVRHVENIADYPYVGDMHGIMAPEEKDSIGRTHVGPVWALDLPGRRFLSPVVGPNSVGGEIGRWKEDPMGFIGGGQGDQEEGYVTRPYSDNTLSRFRRDFHSGKWLHWDASTDSFRFWDEEAHDYGRTIAGNGVNLPVVRNVQVVSVLASSSGVNSDFNHVYPVIGPYESGLIDLFDPQNAADRAKAADLFCDKDWGCDVSVRVTQGGIEKIYMLDIPWREGSFEACDNQIWETAAVNLPAADGEITRVELLGTPDAQVNGLPASPSVLATWQR